MASSRKRDGNGFLLVEGCPITSYGIFDYGAGQLDLPGDPNRIVKVFRPESAVNDPAAIASFQNVPLINDHEILSGFSGDDSATAPEDYGVSGVLTGNVYYDAPWMRGDLKVFSRDMQEKLRSGKKDLSLGYSCDFENKPGVWNGQPYEVVQTNMRGNHIALVDEGRVPGARVLDGLCFDHLNFTIRPSDSKEIDMRRKSKALDNAVEKLKALLPALEEFLNQEAREPEHQDTGATGGESGSGGAESVSGAAGGTNPNAVSGEGSGAASSGAETAGTTAEVTNPNPNPNDAGGSAEAGAGSTEETPTDPNEGTLESSPDVGALVTEVEAVLAEIKAAMSGGQVDNGETSSETGETGEVADAVSGLEGLRERTEGEGAAHGADEIGSGTGGEAAAGTTAATPVAEGGADCGQGKASVGPAAGLNSKANDTALKSFYADLAAKNDLYDRVSRFVGAFDHKSMSARDVAVYGVKKFGIKAVDGQEVVTLDAYLTGREYADRTRNNGARIADAAEKDANSEMDAYLKGVK